MRPREQRLKCVIKARLRLDGVWRDVCIRNISSRGMLLQAGSAPQRGTYVEVYRGKHVIVARVAWAKDNRFGIQTQERLNVQAILSEPDLSGPSYKEVIKTQPTFERRSVSRASEAELRWRAEQNRFKSKALEFACIAAVGGSIAFVLFDTMFETLSQPLTRVSTELSAPNQTH